MRARNIKPAFFKNSKLGKISPYARLAYIGLWCFADFNGNFELDYDRLHIELLPYDRDVDIKEVITSLVKSGNVIIYKVDEELYGHMPKFNDHQRPHPHEVKKGTNIPEMRNQSDAITSNDKKLLGLTNSPDPLSLNPESLILNPEPLKPTQKDLLEERFVRFWNVYPKKKSKGQALKTWMKLKPTEELTTSIINHLEKRVGSDIDWIKEGGQYIPSPSKWLNDQGWEDEYTIGRDNQKTTIDKNLSVFKKAKEKLA